MQRLMHQFKYKATELGKQLGRLMGNDLRHTNHRFNDIDVLIPLPLFRAKEKKRGYNQATILCEGSLKSWRRSIKGCYHSASAYWNADKKGIEWNAGKKYGGKIRLVNPAKIQNKHILLVETCSNNGRYSGSLRTGAFKDAPMQNQHRTLWLCIPVASSQPSP